MVNWTEVDDPRYPGRWRHPQKNIEVSIKPAETGVKWKTDNRAESYVESYKVTLTQWGKEREFLAGGASFNRASSVAAQLRDEYA